MFLLNSLGIGGSEGKSVRMANTLAGRGLNVTMAYLSAPEALRGEVSPDVRLVHLERRGRFSWPALRRLMAAIRERDAPVVVAVNLYSILYAALARRLLGRASFRLVASVNTTDVMTRAAARRMPLYRWALNQADSVIFGANIQRRIWQEQYGIGKGGAAVDVLYNGVDTDRFALPGVPTLRTMAPRTRYVIGTVGLMRPEKAHIDLVKAIAALRAQNIDAGALIVGDGSERARIEEQVARLGLGKYIVLAGESRDVRPFLAQMDVFALTSTGIETFSNAALEAMAAGLPVVTSRVGGMEELIAFGGGVSFAPGDVATLTELLAGLLRDTPRRQQIGADARRAAVEHFAWSRMVDRFVMLLALAER
jgi:glycosyltransferase involved in cell wall biosynthesis